MTLSMGSFAHIETRRETSVALATCHDSQYSPNLPLTKRYLRSILDELISSSPEVFRGDLAKNKICIGPKLSTSQRAWAQAEKRSMEIETGLILRIQNEEQLATVIGHELAHVALRHTPLEGNPVPGDDGIKANLLLKQNAEYMEKLFTLVKGKDAAEILMYQEKEAQVSKEINDLFLKNFDKEFTANWMETEADVTGAVYYLKAGFSSVEIGFRIEQLATDAHRAGLNPRTQNSGRNFDPHAPSPAMSAEDRTELAHRVCELDSSEAPPRGIHRYPMPCWQIWNMRVNLPSTNSEFYQLMQNKTSRNIDRGVTLEEVREEIRTALKNVRPVKS